MGSPSALTAVQVSLATRTTPLGDSALVTTPTSPTKEVPEAVRRWRRDFTASRAKYSTLTAATIPVPTISHRFTDSGGSVGDVSPNWANSSSPPMTRLTTEPMPRIPNPATHDFGGCQHDGKQYEAPLQPS